jgi:Sec-independent protein translocase protein TatA
MESFFGIGLGELIVILILAGLVMGPQRVRQVAFTLGRTLARLQRASRQLTRELNAELDSLDGGELRGAAREMDELRRELASFRREAGLGVSRLAQEATGATPSEASPAVAERPLLGPIPRPLNVDGDPDE